MFSRYEVYTTVQSIYCYPDSDVLKNKLNILDHGELTCFGRRTGIAQYSISIYGLGAKRHPS